uniref:CSC1/OSCA1-like 7TM region domain-containing protein n=1 Tax=Lotharella globosa TaxID=91324 RepID=A0A7S4E0M5_9EUKA|mmetsp:Transcript_29171/g.56571  ORF Transcript_29171/g.56571 Transcript_29171/m.56571 type:complete len:743 (+) Transcript_29171:33-2261(+)
MSDGAALVSVLVPSILAATTYFVVFESLRGYYTSFFAPKYPGCESGGYPHKSLFGWLWGVWSVSEDALMKRIGMDAAVYLRFLGLGVQTMAILTVLGLVLLAPIYSRGQKQATDLTALTLSNLKQQEDKLWAPAILMWFFSFIIWYLVYKNYNEVTALRKKAMNYGDSSQYTILITKIPLQYDTEARIREWLEPKYPGTIFHIQPVRDLSALSAATRDLQKEQLRLDRASAKAKENGEAKTRTGCSGCCGEEVEAVAYHSQRADEKRKEVSNLLEESSGKLFRGAAFVTFSTVAEAVKAANTPLTVDETWESQKATQAEDVIWNNVCNVPDAKTKRTLDLIASATFFCLIVFWAIPVALGGALSNLEELGREYPWLKGISDWPKGLIAIIEGFGPTLWRVILMLLLKPILRRILLQTRIIEGSTLELDLMSTFYLFLLVNIYFVTLLSSSVFTTITQIIDHPLRVFELLGSEVPKVSFIMIQYMVLQGFTVQTYALVRLDGLLVAIFFKHAVAGVDYERRRAMKPWPFQYGVGMAFACLMWTICMCYMAVAPLILPFGLIYFSMDYMVAKYTLLYVSSPKFETYGKAWPKLMRFALNGLILAQVALMAIVGLKYGYWQQLMLFPLPVLTYLFSQHLYTSQGELMENSQLPLVNALELDKSRDPQAVKQLLQETADLNVWEQPCMRIDPNDPLKEPAKPPVLSDSKEGHDAWNSIEVGSPPVFADQKTHLLADHKGEKDALTS